MLVHVTVHVAPAAHVTVDPAPTVIVHELPLSHVTLAEAPATSAHVAWLLHSRFELSPAVTEQLLCAPHSVLHEPPHVPLHVVADAQSKLHPVVCAPHAPEPLRLHEPPPLHEHFVPVHAAGAPTDPVLVPPDEHAMASTPTNAAAIARFAWAIIESTERI